jgi:tetratricopeptide (TPR) repeat protein
MDFESSNVPSSSALLCDQIKHAESLRNIGRSFLSTKQYSKAASCYAAVLQVIEGVGGSESGDLRRRCGLTLAECEIKVGNLYAAIARCSEVIDECPAITDLDCDAKCENMDKLSENEMEEKKLRQALGQAYYRRGVALSRLEEPDLALLDLQQALKKIPDDVKILQRLETLESVILNYDKGSTGSETSSKSDLEEQLQSIAEDAQANYQRAHFSRKQIRDLLQRNLSNGKSLTKKLKTSGSSNDFGGIGDFFSKGMGPSLQGLGGFGNLSGKNGGGTDTSGLLGNLGMMLRLFSGLDNKTIGLIEEIAEAVLDVFQLFKKTFNVIITYRTQIIAVMTSFWVFFILSPYLPFRK